MAVVILSYFTHQLLSTSYPHWLGRQRKGREQASFAIIENVHTPAERGRYSAAARATGAPVFMDNGACMAKCGSSGTLQYWSRGHWWLLAL